jgi:hypothetical protein
MLWSGGEKEESVPACMLWSGAGKRGDLAGAHAREKGREGECAGTYGLSGALADEQSVLFSSTKAVFS